MEEAIKQSAKEESLKAMMKSCKTKFYNIEYVNCFVLLCLLYWIIYFTLILISTFKEWKKYWKGISFQFHNTRSTQSYNARKSKSKLELSSFTNTISNYNKNSRDFWIVGKLWIYQILIILSTDEYYLLYLNVYYLC